MAKKKKKKIKKEVKGKNIKNIKNAPILEPSLEKKKAKSLKVEKNNDVSSKIQNFISILFTIVIFLALILLLFVLYNNYLKPKKYDKEKICASYIKEDIKINTDEITNYIKDIRAIIYNLDNLSSNHSEEEIKYLITYFIWGSSDEYLLCEGEENCLITKKEIEKEKVNKFLGEYFNLEKINFPFYTNNFTDDDQIRLYEKDDKLVLTFSEFSYETFKHEIIDISSDSSLIKVIFALSEKIENSEDYRFVGTKTITLKYVSKNLILNEIKTSLK